jgi:hypothetical protein
VCVCNLKYPACKAHAPYCIVIRGLSGCTIFFLHYLTKATIFRKYLQNIKCAFCFSLKFPSETFLILRRNQRDIIINVNRSSFKVPVLLFTLYSNLNFPYNFSKNLLISNFIKIPPIGAELFHAERQTDRQTGRSSQLLFAILRKRVIKGTSVVTSNSHSHGLFLLRSILMLSSYFLIRFLGRHFEDTSYFHILATSPVHYWNIHLNPVPFSVPEHNL